MDQIMDFVIKGLLALQEAARRKIQEDGTSQPYLLSPCPPCSPESHASDGGGDADAEAHKAAALRQKKLKKDEGWRPLPAAAPIFVGGVVGGVLGLWYAGRIEVSVEADATRQREQRTGTSQPASTSRRWPIQVPFCA